MARYKSVVLDLDSALLTDADARAAALAGNEKQLAALAETGLIEFDPEIQRLATAAKSGGACVSLISRFSNGLIQTLSGNVCGKGVVDRWCGGIASPERFAGYLAWVDKELGTDATDHAVLVGHMDVFDHAAGAGSHGVDLLLGAYHAEGCDYGSTEQLSRLSSLARRVLAVPATVRQTKRQLSVNLAKEPVLRGVPDHGVGYLCDAFAVGFRKDRGIFDIGSPTDEMMRLKRLASDKRAGLASLLRAYGMASWGELFVERSEPFVIVPIHSSRDKSKAEDKQLSYLMAEAIVAEGVPATVERSVRRIKNLDQDWQRESIEEQCASLAFVRGDEARLDGKDVLLIDDNTTEGTTGESYERIIRNNAEPATVCKLSIGKFAVGRLLDFARAKLDGMATPAAKLAAARARYCLGRPQRYLIRYPVQKCPLDEALAEPAAG